MNVGGAIVDRLVASGIEVVFGIPGKQTLPLNAHMTDRDDIRFVMARHETAISHQAWGYAETGGGLAATLVVPGPGDMNAMNGLKNALNDCTPLLHVSIETDPSIRGKEGIHETPPETYDTVVKENIIVDTPYATIAELDRAIEKARTPPMGPVRLGIPKSFLTMNVELADGKTDSVDEAPVSTRAITRAAEILAEARAPVILAGGGVRAGNASSALRSVAERLDASVVTSVKGKGTFPEDHPLSVGVACSGSSTELAEHIAAADAALAVGTDFDAVWTSRWRFEVPGRLVHVTLDPSALGRGYEPSVAIIGDAAQTLIALDSSLANRQIASRDGEERAGVVRSADAERLSDIRELREPSLTTVSALSALRESLPRKTIVTADAGGSRIWTLVAFPVYHPRRYVNPGSWATMGIGLPAAIGAKIAHPDKPVVTIIGEGGLMMCIEEMHTLVAESIPVIIIVFANDDYAIISEEARRAYDLDNMAFGWRDAPLDLVKIASGMGLSSAYVETTDELTLAVKTALSEDVATLVEVPTDPLEPQASEWMTRPSGRETQDT